MSPAQLRAASPQSTTDAPFTGGAPDGAPEAPSLPGSPHFSEVLAREEHVGDTGSWAEQQATPSAGDQTPVPAATSGGSGHSGATPESTDGLPPLMTGRQDAVRSAADPATPRALNQSQDAQRGRRSASVSEPHDARPRDTTQTTLPATGDLTSYVAAMQQMMAQHSTPLPDRAATPKAEGTGPTTPAPAQTTPGSLPSDPAAGWEPQTGVAAGAATSAGNMQSPSSSASPVTETAAPNGDAGDPRSPASTDALPAVTDQPPSLPNTGATASAAVPSYRPAQAASSASGGTAAAASPGADATARWSGADPTSGRQPVANTIAAVARQTAPEAAAVTAPGADAFVQTRAPGQSALRDDRGTTAPAQASGGEQSSSGAQSSATGAAWSRTIPAPEQAAPNGAEQVVSRMAVQASATSSHGTVGEINAAATRQPAPASTPMAGRPGGAPVGPMQPSTAMPSRPHPAATASITRPESNSAASTELVVAAEVAQPGRQMAPAMPTMGETSLAQPQRPTTGAGPRQAMPALGQQQPASASNQPYSPIADPGADTADTAPLADAGATGAGNDRPGPRAAIGGMLGRPGAQAVQGSRDRVTAASTEQPEPAASAVPTAGVPDGAPASPAQPAAAARSRPVASASTGGSPRPATPQPGTPTMARGPQPASGADQPHVDPSPVHERSAVSDTLPYSPDANPRTGATTGAADGAAGPTTAQPDPRAATEGMLDRAGALGTLDHADTAAAQPSVPAAPVASRPPVPAPSTADRLDGASVSPVPPAAAAPSRPRPIPTASAIDSPRSESDSAAVTEPVVAAGSAQPGRHSAPAMPQPGTTSTVRGPQPAFGADQPHVVPSPDQERAAAIDTLLYPPTASSQTGAATLATDGAASADEAQPSVRTSTLGMLDRADTPADQGTPFQATAASVQQAAPLTPATTRQPAPAAFMAPGVGHDGAPVSPAQPASIGTAQPRPAASAITTSNLQLDRIQTVTADPAVVADAVQTDGRPAPAMPQPGATTMARDPQPAVGVDQPHAVAAPDQEQPANARHQPYPAPATPRAGAAAPTPLTADGATGVGHDQLNPRATVQTIADHTATAAAQLSVPAAPVAAAQPVPAPSMATAGRLDGAPISPAQPAATTSTRPAPAAPVAATGSSRPESASAPITEPVATAATQPGRPSTTPPPDATTVLRAPRPAAGTDQRQAIPAPDQEQPASARTLPHPLTANPRTNVAAAASLVANGATGAGNDGPGPRVSAGAMLDRASSLATQRPLDRTGTIGAATRTVGRADGIGNEQPVSHASDQTMPDRTDATFTQRSAAAPPATTRQPAPVASAAGRLDGAPTSPMPPATIDRTAHSGPGTAVAVTGSARTDQTQAATAPPTAGATGRRAMPPAEVPVASSAAQTVPDLAVTNSSTQAAGMTPASGLVVSPAVGSESPVGTRRAAPQSNDDPLLPPATERAPTATQPASTAAPRYQPSGAGTVVTPRAGARAEMPVGASRGAPMQTAASGSRSTADAPTPLAATPAGSADVRGWRTVDDVGMQPTAVGVVPAHPTAPHPAAPHPEGTRYPAPGIQYPTPDTRHPLAGVQSQAAPQSGAIPVGQMPMAAMAGREASAREWGPQGSRVSGTQSGSWSARASMAASAPISPPRGQVGADAALPSQAGQLPGNAAHPAGMPRSTQTANNEQSKEGEQPANTVRHDQQPVQQPDHAVHGTASNLAAQGSAGFAQTLAASQGADGAPAAGASRRTLTGAGRALAPIVDAIVVRHASLHVGQSASSFRVVLQPETLGTVTVQVERGQDGLHVTLTPEHAQTQTLLNQHMPELLSSLQASNLGPVQTSVVSATESRHHGSGATQPQQSAQGLPTAASNAGGGSAFNQSRQAPEWLSSTGNEGAMTNELPVPPAPAARSQSAGAARPDAASRIDVQA